MTVITAANVRAAAKSRVNEGNLKSVLLSLDRYGAQFGMALPHRLAQHFAQIMYESGDFRYDQEIWAPTPAQEGYDTRTDLGNTPQKDGDGYLYRGRTAMQLTGKDNYRQFRDWCDAQCSGECRCFPVTQTQHSMFKQKLVSTKQSPLVRLDVSFWAILAIIPALGSRQTRHLTFPAFLQSLDFGTDARQGVVAYHQAVS